MLFFFYRYFLFAATLVVMSNEFACLFQHQQYNTSIANAIEVMDYCSKTDVQANRLLFILKSFQDVIKGRADSFEMGYRARSLQLDMSDGILGGPLAVLAGVSSSSSSSISARKQSSNASFPTDSRKHSAAFSHASPKQHIPNTCTKLLIFDNPRPDYIRAASASSSASGHTTSTQPRAARSGRVESEGERPESLSGEQEFDFDSFWECPPAGHVLSSQVPSQGVHDPQAIPVSLGTALVTPSHYVLPYPYPTYTGAPVQSSSQRPIFGPNVPIYPSTTFLG